MKRNFFFNQLNYLLASFFFLAPLSTINAAQCLDVFASGTQTSSPELILPPFLNSSSSTDFSGGSLSITAGQYDNIYVSQNGNVNFTTTGGVYRIDRLRLGENATATFAPGDYYIDELELEEGAEIIVSGTGTVRIYSNEVSFDEDVRVAVGTPYFILIAYDEVEIEENLTFFGVLYSDDEIEIDEDGSITGAIHGDDIDLDDGTSVSYNTGLITGADFNGMCEGGSSPGELVAHYQMEEASWGSVIDSINGINGTAYNGADTIGTSCRYGLFDGIDDYIQIPHDASLNGSDALTYVAFVRADSWSGLTQIMAKSVHGGGSGRAQMGMFSENGVFKGRAQTVNGRREIQMPLPLIAGDWDHIALVFSGTALTLYQNGIAQASTSFPATTLVQTTDPLNISKRVGTDTYYFHGLIDDVRVYTLALTAQEVLDLYNSLTPCQLTAVDHIQLSHDGAGLTCADETITLTACADAACSSVATSDVIVNLSATGATSSWSQNPVTIPANSNAGVTVSLTHRTAETITLNATATPATTNNVICIPDCDLTFSEAGFLLSLSNHQSCTTPNLIIQAVKMSDTGTSCAPAYSGNQSVNFTFNYNEPTSGGRLPDLNSSSMAASGVAKTLPINFDSTASASLSFQYNDAGQIDIIVSDGGDNGLSSATVSPIVTPAKLLISTSDTNNACTGPDYGNCSAFKVAGTAGNIAGQFDLVIAGACSNDTVTPNFELNAIALSSNLVAPSTGTNANLGINAADITTSGTVTISQTISEVGAFSITATPPPYLGQTTPSSIIPSATSSTIGRFIPARFIVTDNSPMFSDATCDFTYQDQPFDFAPGLSPEISIRAVNSEDVTTQNYGGDGVANNDFWKLDANLLSSRNYVNQVTTFPGSLTANLGVITTAGAGNYDGSNTFTLPSDQLTYNKSAVTPVALPTVINDTPFNASVSLQLTAASLTDSDGVFYDDPNNGTGSSDAYLSTDITGTNIRWGRWFISNAFGSELQPLALVAEAQYFNGNNFLLNTTDSCTSPLTIVLSDYAGNLSAGETTLTQGAMASGLIPLTLSAPNNGNDGSLLLTLTTPTWMRYDFDGDSILDDANATAIFGIFEGRKPVIIKRQQF